MIVIVIGECGSFDYGLDFDHAFVMLVLMRMRIPGICS